MARCEAKTRATAESVKDFIASLENETRRTDANTLLKVFADVTGWKPRMWGPSIIGFGSYHYRYASGREGDAPLTGFSPRKQNLSVYLAYGFERQADLLERLGKHKLGKACLYLKRLDDADPAALRELIERSVAELARANAPGGPPAA